jgi:DNA adenine methylase
VYIKVEPKTPFLWAGSKNKNWDDISRYIPVEFTRYVEPFLGGGSVYFKLLNSRAGMQSAVSDINSDLINCYMGIRDGSDYITKNLPLTKNREIFNAWVKDHTNGTQSDNAMRFLYLNRNRFFGLGGWMNADRYARDAIIERIKFYSPRMSNTVFYEDAFRIELLSDDFVFCDPPYPETNNNSCYNIDDAGVLNLNLKYLQNLKNANCKFLFITKNVSTIKNLATSLGFVTEIKRWTFRRPGKGVQTSEELWISLRTPQQTVLDFLE